MTERDSPSLSRLEQDVARAQRHLQKVVPKAEKVTGEKVPTDDCECRDFAEECKQHYEDLETLYAHFDRSFQRYKDAFDKIPDPDAETVRKFDEFDDFCVEVLRTQNKLRVRITRLDEELASGHVRGSVVDDSSSTVSHSHPYPTNATVYRTPALPQGKPDANSIGTTGGAIQGLSGSLLRVPTSVAGSVGTTTRNPASEQRGQPPLAIPAHDPHLSSFGERDTPLRACYDAGFTYGGGAAPDAFPPGLLPRATTHTALPGTAAVGLSPDASPFIPGQPNHAGGHATGPNPHAAGAGQGLPGYPLPTVAETRRQDPPQGSMSELVALLTEAINGKKPERGGVVRLPKIDLPTFSGRYADWQPFWDRFERTVDRNSTLTGSDKLTYPTSCLRDKAAMLVKNLRTTNENYDTAVAILKNAFGNRVIAVESIQSKIIDMKPVLKYDFPKLKEFYFEVENLVGSLDALGADTSNFVGLLMKKLPFGIVTAIERIKGVDKLWTMDLFRAALKHELDIREAALRRSSCRYGSETSIPERPRTGANASRPVSTADALASLESEVGACADSRPKKIHTPTLRNKRFQRQGASTPAAAAGGPTVRAPPSPCMYCHGRHWSKDCSKLKTIDERREFLLQAGKCFVCLERGHRSRDCPSERACFGCRKRGSHHVSLCPDLTMSAKVGDQARAGVEEDAASTKVHDLTIRDEHSTLADDESTVLKTAVLTIVNPVDPSKLARIRAFLDTGTSRSFLSEKMAKQLKLQIQSERMLRIKRFGPENEEPFLDEVRTARLNMKSLNGDTWVINVATSKQMIESISKSCVPQSLLKDLPADIHLADEMLPTKKNVAIDLMIGNDYYDELLTGKKLSLGNGLWLVESVFGWIPSGRLPEAEESHAAVTVALSLSQFSDDVTISDLWRLETIGIHDKPDPVDDDVALEKFNSTLEFKDGRYYVTWPWTVNACQLPTNYYLALRRLRSMLTRHQRLSNWDFLQRYDDVMKDQIKNNVLEEVTSTSGADKTESRVHYLAHHGVETPWKTTKLRVVYDASAKSKPELPSLNECVYRGAVFLENVVTLLLRFRCYKIGIVSDVEKAFLQIGIQEKDRDVTRLLWVRDIHRPPSESNLVTYRFQRVPFGVKASPFLLGATLRHHLQEIGGKTAGLIAKNIYVDNVIVGVSTTDEALSFYHHSKQIFKSAGMNLREYGSNNEEMMRSIPEVDRVKDDSIKVLGLTWERSSDSFVLRSPKMSGDVVTKKFILSNLFKVFDPLGFVAPVTITGKILLQTLTKSRLGWDSPVPETAVAQWTQVASQLAKVQELTLPRCTGEPSEDSRIMAFCDASTSAFATVLYLQNRQSSSRYSSNLIFAKAQVSPIKHMTIPRLELLAVLIGVRAVEFVRQSLSFTGTAFVWTDSACVLHWINSKKVQATFVENRLREIRRSANVTFKYVPSAENVADRASRGCKVDCLDFTWFRGPAWAAGEESCWPEQAIQQTPVTEDIGPGMDVAVPAYDDQVGLPNTSPMDMDPAKYSSFKRLLRVTAWCFRFLDKLRRHDGDSLESVSLALCPNEISKAEKAWIQYEQEVGYPELLRAIRGGRSHQLQRQLGVTLHEDGILRCHSRLLNIEADDRTKFPVLLHPKSHITNLIIIQCHAASFHAGVSQTLACLRREFWVPRGRSRVASVIRRCLTCQRWDGGSFSRPPMPNLPSCRVKRHRPFQHAGLDNFGPILVRTATGTAKRWVTIFTCLTVRAVHLEYLQNQSAEEFMLAFRRFIAQRGKPKSVICDNASQFKAVKAADPFSDFLSGERITWRFIPQLAPWAGGVYERLVKSVKTALKKVIGRRLLTDVQFITLLVEAQNVVNSRPLTYQTDDVHEERAITPNDFVATPSSTGILTDDADGPDDDYAEGRPSTRDVLRDMFRRDVRLLDQFWNTWSNDYILSLREKLTWMHRDPRGSICRSPCVGEVVLIREPMQPRAKWVYGRISYLVKSTDGSVRAVKVRLGSGRSLLRPVNLLTPLECESERSEEPSKRPESSKVFDKTVAKAKTSPVPRRSNRIASAYSKDFQYPE